MAGSGSISIITINYNGYDDTCELMDTIPFGMEGLDVVVVDNGSTSNEAARLQQRYPAAKVVQSDTNLGFAGANNLGVRHAEGQLLFFVNNDARFFRPGHPEKTADMLRRMSQHFDRQTALGLLCPVILNDDSKAGLQWAGYTALTHVTLRNRAVTALPAAGAQPLCATPYAHGAAMMTRRDVLERAGMMCEDYFLYYEELDWSLAVRRAGYNIAVATDCHIYHKASKTTGQDSPLKTYYLTRNRLAFASRNVSQPCRIVSLVYQMAVVAPRDWLRYTLSHQAERRRSLALAIADYLCGRMGPCRHALKPTAAMPSKTH
ncbi:MAG: glycosyltransferase family 2 protein [Prevotella sp.]|nr:glycosyltransferase family 2 protein [Prevotella sp.]